MSFILDMLIFMRRFEGVGYRSLGLRRGIWIENINLLVIFVQRERLFKERLLRVKVRGFMNVNIFEVKDEFVKEIEQKR